MENLKKTSFHKHYNSQTNIWLVILHKSDSGIKYNTVVKCIDVFLFEMSIFTLRTSTLHDMYRLKSYMLFSVIKSAPCHGHFLNMRFLFRVSTAAIYHLHAENWFVPKVMGDVD